MRACAVRMRVRARVRVGALSCLRASDPHESTCAANDSHVRPSNSHFNHLNAILAGVKRTAPKRLPNSETLQNFALACLRVSMHAVVSIF